MKKLLIAPFLLASLFSFGGELKANSNSRYELPDPRSSLSESQSNSKDVWYLLNQNVVERKYTKERGRPWTTRRHAKQKIYTFPSRSFCQRFATQQRTWLTSIDLGEGGDEGYEQGVANSRFKYKPYTKCIKGRDKNYANYHLEINTFDMFKYYSTDPGVIKPNNEININTLYFKDFSKCNLAKSQLENWFTSIKDKSLAPNLDGSFLGFSTKCIRKF